jgi:hypothetical protein
VHLRASAYLLALKQTLDEIDPSARAIEFVTQQLVGRARRGAETAMDALAQDTIGLLTLRCVFDEIG